MTLQTVLCKLGFHDWLLSDYSYKYRQFTKECQHCLAYQVVTPDGVLKYESKARAEAIDKEIKREVQHDTEV